MLQRTETRKDLVQVAVESAFSHVGEIAGIIAGAGRDVTREIGDWATEVFEMREAARRAESDPAGAAVPGTTVAPPIAELEAEAPVRRRSRWRRR